MKPIRTIHANIIFYIDCKDSEIEEATKIANELAEKFVKKGCKSNGIRFANLNLMKQYLAVL